MKIVVFADDVMWDEFSAKKLPADWEVVRLDSYTEISKEPFAAAYFDLSPEITREKLHVYESLVSTPVFVNSVHLTNSDLLVMADFGNEVTELVNTVRINGWPTFLQRDIIEVAQCDVDFENVFTTLGWKYEATPDLPGFITARVVSMIINEAWFALEENVSSKEEIDTAMKLGTNYPYGPFEWGEKIGLKKIHELLTTLAMTNSRYQPCALLSQQVASI